ncbi:MAG: cytochrome C [Alphaproteobacteria bacterium HGW-Alphaproteobacteria-6]|nr:MAG: cytochrome C [Alphaproteobacteria bacterium HGW-Alphaproteobacteria-6]
MVRPDRPVAPGGVFPARPPSRTGALAALALLAGLTFVTGLAGAPARAEVPEGNAEAGKTRAGACRTCHGIDGFARIPIAPHIGGENAAYISHQLTAFRDGSRSHEIMSVVAAGLDDQAIADLAAWYSGQSITVALPAGVAAEGAPEDCVACHGADGVALIEDAPHLAGENAIYIDTQLKAFRSGKRSHPIMSEIAAGLSDADIRAVAEWYAAIGFKVTAAP